MFWGENCSNVPSFGSTPCLFQAAHYWEGVNPTIDGMLGGFAKISHTDIDGSNKLVKASVVVLDYYSLTTD